MSKAKRLIQQRRRQSLREQQRAKHEAEARRIEARRASASQHREEQRRLEDRQAGDNRRVEIMIEEILELGAALDYPGAELIATSWRLSPILIRRTVAGWHLGGSIRQTPGFDKDSETGDFVLQSVRSQCISVYLLEDGRVVSRDTDERTPNWGLSQQERDKFQRDDSPTQERKPARYSETNSPERLHRSFADKLQEPRKFEPEIRRLLRFLQE